MSLGQVTGSVVPQVYRFKGLKMFSQKMITGIRVLCNKTFTFEIVMILSRNTVL